MTAEELQKRLSANLKSLRKQAEYSQEVLAERAQISYQMMNDIEGCRRWPSEKTLVKLANALGVDVGILFQSEQSVDALNPLQKQIAVNEIYRIFTDAVKCYLAE